MFHSFSSVQLIWIYFVTGRSPTTSNFIVLCLFMQKVFTRVVCVNGKHPQSSCVILHYEAVLGTLSLPSLAL